MNLKDILRDHQAGCPDPYVCCFNEVMKEDVGEFLQSEIKRCEDEINTEFHTAIDGMLRKVENGYEGNGNVHINNVREMLKLQKIEGEKRAYEKMLKDLQPIVGEPSEAKELK
jgi:hypothetical protein